MCRLCLIGLSTPCPQPYHKEAGETLPIINTLARSGLLAACKPLLFKPESKGQLNMNTHCSALWHWKRPEQEPGITISFEGQCTDIQRHSAAHLSCRRGTELGPRALLCRLQHEHNLGFVPETEPPQNALLELRAAQFPCKLKWTLSSLIHKDCFVFFHPERQHLPGPATYVVQKSSVMHSKWKKNSKLRFNAILHMLICLQSPSLTPGRSTWM